MSYLHDLWLRYTLPKKPEKAPVDLSTHDGYMVAAAMRGPDRPAAGAVKWVFTARIRWLAGAREDNSYSTREVKTNPYYAGQLRKQVEQWRIDDASGLSHYLSHITEAARALGDKDLADLAYICAARALDTTSDSGIIRLAGGD